LSAHSELEKQLLASDLTSVFKRLSTSWGDQMSSVMGNAILAFLESERAERSPICGVFWWRGIPGVVPQDRARPRVVYYWQREFPLLSGRPQGPLLTRLTFSCVPSRSVTWWRRKKTGSISPDHERGENLSRKLSQGAIGEENAYRSAHCWSPSFINSPSLGRKCRKPAAATSSLYR
jgi:hypothetical protein